MRRDKQARFAQYQRLLVASMSDVEQQLAHLHLEIRKLQEQQRAFWMAKWAIEVLGDSHD